jgi:hypothetical protein
MHCDEFDFPRLDAPGLKARPSRAIPKRLYWVARADLVKAGYRPETVRISFDITDPTNHRLIEKGLPAYAGRDACLESWHRPAKACFRWHDRRPLPCVPD